MVDQKPVPVAERAAPARELFPSRSGLPVSSSWWASVLVATGGSLMVVVSLGAMAGELGNASIWVWIVTAAVGGLICMLVGELAGRFPERAGGTAQFAFRARPGGSTVLGALSAWGYWFAWTPGIAVNLILAATILKDLLWSGVNTIALAAAIGLGLYAITAMGLKLSTVVNGGLAVLAVALVAVIVAGPLVKPGVLDLSEVFPTRLPEETTGAGAIALLVIKWAFVASWSAYAAEMASTVCAEIRRPERYMRRVMSVSAVICLFAFTAVPVALFATVGVDGVADEPLEVFTSAGEAILGEPGRMFVGLGLAAVLILGAETFIIGSSRTIYQMSRDGHLPPFFGKVNRHGAPVGSIVWDAVVIATMLVVFGTEVVDVVAAANVGYLIVFVLLPFAYLVLRKLPGGRPDALLLSRPWAAVAVGVLVFNAVLLVVGGIQWGLSVMLVGLSVTFSIVPISWATRRWNRSRSGTPEIPPAVAVEGPVR